MRVLRLIDRGGFGIVHEILTDRGHRFARKSFDPQVSDTEDREKLKRRFEREVRIQSQIRHPNIMPIIEKELDESPPWFTMPLAHQTFITKIENDRSKGIVDPKPWQDILAAVEELHRLGYVHRDLKPANILLVNDTWVLSDFGLILPMTRDTTVLTSSKSAYGSHYYAAPEQAQDFRNTPEQADIFSLGCILHDAVECEPRRIPFAQVRTSGNYGPLLEKCTEVNPKKRFPSIAALRAALFDLWRTSQFSGPANNDASQLDIVLANPASVDGWRALINYAENLGSSDRSSILTAMNAEMIGHLFNLDDVLYGRLLHLICEWAGSTSFEWEYCDIVGDRLLEAYRISPIRIKCIIVLASLQLAISHNRWHVMKQVGAMLGQAADNGLVDRIIIEMSLNGDIEQDLRKIERTVDWNRDRWHKKIADLLNIKDSN